MSQDTEDSPPALLFAQETKGLLHSILEMLGIMVTTT